MAIRWRGLPASWPGGELVGSSTTSSRVPTSRARSRPVIEGSAAISSRACASVTAAGNSPPFIAPWSRMWRTSARVSRSVIAGIPQSVSHDSQPRSARGRILLAVDAGAHDRRARVDPVGFHRLGADPVVADLRVGEREQLAGVAGVGHRLLVARHRGREHDLSDGVIVGAAREPVKARAVVEQHVGGRVAHERLSALECASSGSVYASAPAAIVSLIRPCSVRPWKQQLAERLT